MKKLCVLSFIAAFVTLQLFAQQGVVYHPAEIKQPVYFDISPSMKDLPNLGVTKADMTWKDGIIKNQPDPRIRQNNPWEPDPVIQSVYGVTTTDTTILNIEGNTNTNGVLPPDTYGECGPTRYFQVVNCHYSIYTKTGTKLMTTNNSTVWSGLPNNSNDGDATLNYDEVHDRWVFAQFSLPTFPNGPFFQMIAVSQTNDPQGSWWRYQYQFSYMPDYPKLAIWPDGIYMSANRFSSGSTQYQGTLAAAFDYEKMLVGDPSASMITFTLPATNAAYCFLPSDCDGEFPPAGTPNYFMYINDNPDQIVVYELHSDWTNPTSSTFSQTTIIPVASFTGSISGITQKGSTIKLDDLSGRMMYRLQFRNFSDHMSAVGNVTVNVGSGQAGIRWFELRNTGSGWTMYQQGTYSPDANNRWMGSIAMDTYGNIALGYSIASSSIYPSIRYTGRRDGDPLGEMTIEEREIKVGGGAQTESSARWGDYSGMSVDPADPGTFWYTQEYMAFTTPIGWKTRIASFTFTFKAIVTATPSSICLGDSSQLNAAAHGGSGSYTYNWTSIPAGFSSTLPNPVVAPLVNTQYICTVHDGSAVTTDTVAVAVHQEPTANAGADQNFAYTVITFNASGTASDYKNLKWKSTGNGTFDSDTILNPVYSTSWQDRMAGTFSLILFAYPIPNCNITASDTMTVTFSPSVGIQNNGSAAFSISIFPNPAQNAFTLSILNLLESEATITLTDMTGRQVYSEVIRGPQSSVSRNIDLKNIARGVYFLRVKADSGMKTEKLVVQ